MWEVKALKKNTPNTKKTNTNSLNTPPQTPVRHPARGANLWVKPEHVVPFKAEPKIW